jgi:uncharacterized membrane protein
MFKKVGKVLLYPFLIIGSLAIIILALSLVDYGFYLLSPVLVIVLCLIVLYNLYRFIKYLWKSIFKKRANS